MAGNYLLDNEGEQAARRFDALSDVFDPVTFRHLEAVGVDTGLAVLGSRRRWTIRAVMAGVESR